MARHQRKLAKERFWRDHLTRWRSSGLSVRAYCRAEGLSEPSFYAWRRMLADRQQRPQPAKKTTCNAQPAMPTFVPVRLIEEPSPGASGAVLEVVVRGGRVVRVTPGFRAETLRAVVTALEGLSC